MDEIARIAGISRARLYQIYSNRRNVFGAMVAEETRALTGQVILEMAMEPDLRRKVEALVRVFFQLAARRRQRYRVLYSQPDASDHELGTILRNARDALANALSNELAESEFSSNRAQNRFLAHGVTAMAEGCAVAWVGHPQSRLDDAIRLVVSLALNSLGMGD